MTPRLPPGYPRPGMKSYHLTTFGCQMNEHDSERMKGMLESLGYAEAQERERAGTEDDFTAELELDEDGLVVRYPRLAERVPSGARA